MRTQKVKINSGKEFIIADLLISNSEITLSTREFSITKTGEYPFQILQEIRRELEERNHFILINGSRKDVYPSGMTLQGDRAYVQVISKPTSINDLVGIFDETDRLDLIGTVEEQKEYHNSWIKSILAL